MSEDVARALQLLVLSPVIWAACAIACQALTRALTPRPPAPDDDWL